MDFVAVDVETTGTLYYVDSIVELAAVRFSDGKKQDSFSTLVNPGVPMPKIASDINKITDEMLKDKPPIKDILKDFSDFCENSPLVAHNAIFDFQFLSVAFEKNYCIAPTGSFFDTYFLSKKCFAGLSNYKLSTIVEHLKFSVSQFHRAEQDAWACGQVFNIILQAMNLNRQENAVCLNQLTKVLGKKELRFPVLKAHQLSLFEV